MKKLLLVSTAIAGVATMSAPASAALKMDLGGFFRGYGVYADNNEPAGAATSLHRFEFRRDSELHFNGETTLDNGLTIGAHTELKVANGDNSVLADETYAYASGGWGRVNLGVEDGAAYLLQVAAPSADSNVDGMRVNIQGINVVAAPAGTDNIASLGFTDYQHADFRDTDRLTFVTPKLNGFQAGVSYAPRDATTSNTGGMSLDNGPLTIYDASSDTLSGGNFKNLWEASARWDGEFQGFGVSLGAGYSDSSLNSEATAALIDSTTVEAAGDWGLNDGIETWNGGASVVAYGFSLGGAYKHSKTSRVADTTVGAGVTSESTGITNTVWVAGVAYDNGPYHVGGSYLRDNLDFKAGSGGDDFDLAQARIRTTKSTVGGGYTFGPGMTFRGSVAWGKFDTTGTDNTFKQVTVGTDVQF